MFSAVLLILQALKIEFDVAYVNEIFTAVLGLLVVVGIIIDPTKVATKTTQQQEIKGAKAEVKSTEAEEQNLKEDTNQTTLPIVEKDEVDNINNENDIQIVLGKITQDLQTRIKELSALNKDTASMLVSLQQPAKETEKTVKTSDEEVEIDILNSEEVPTPAAAEMENPYINLMN